MEGIIAVLGFWIFLLAIIAKKPLMTYLEQSKEANKDLTALTQRVQQLEGSVVTIGTDIQEVKDTSEFAHRLLIDSAQQIADAHKLLTQNVQQMADAKKLLDNFQANQSQSTITVVAKPAHEAETKSSGSVPPQANEPKLIANERKLLTTGTPLINELGKVIADGTIRFERVLPAPIERVWQYLTAPDCLPQWLAAGNIDQRFGGKVELNFDVEEMPERQDHGAKIHGAVSFLEPLRTLSYSWNDDASKLQSNVCFQVSADGDQTTLVVTHSQLPQDRLHEVMAGWHTHLDILKARLTDAMPPSFRKRYREVLQTYAAVVATTVVISTAALAAPAAVAAPASPQAYQTIQSERSHILSRYDAIARDADDLKRRIADLKRDASPEADRTVEQLEKQLDDSNQDLRTLDLDIRDLDNALK
jgi:uncharacterized protein YndB with AHSA1/START domain/predicted  nucleic acid-binding Zn-ribbon protein